jgi:hypothetical protein
MLTDTLTMSNPTLRSHTHLQFAQGNAQTKNCKRVCLPNRTDTATLDGQATTEKEGRTHNTGLAKVAVQCSADTFVVNQSLVLRINICGENRHLRQARNRYLQL